MDCIELNRVIKVFFFFYFRQFHAATTSGSKLIELPLSYLQDSKPVKKETFSSF